MPKKVMVSGCYDLLHSGHIAFFKEAAAYGDLYVALGSDKTVYELKGRLPVNSEQERLFMVKSVGFVKDAFVSQGSGVLDYVEELETLKPDVFVVNGDGHTPDKEQLCRDTGVEYVILSREPYEGLERRSTTDLRTVNRVPFRIDLAGGWLDQPFVSQHHPGAVVTISIEPTIEFNERSGMASSTRNAAIDLWGPRLPIGNPEKLAKVLFCYDNPPGTQEISGSQDAIGIVFPGLACAHYDGDYWPAHIDTMYDEDALRFVEQALYLVALGPRHAGFAVLSETCIDRDRAGALAQAAADLWGAIQARDLHAFGMGMRRGFEAQIAMFPKMVTPQVERLVEQYRDRALGWKLSGAGGGGYLVLASETPIPNAVRIVARRMSD
ncbi:adenylyltransferase/cytidyltransferase family protein [Aggregatilinea lenta]|uniref:adenylyltransferase/cytidyltransferase family protein n=1 Tax=Aggregatilinea lenta TaxID=913108 RepID=UPI000E5BBAF0|nr:adenylyltransferase/cytidyltransferase family protein [Aggregatilinea lenta]